MSKKYRSGAQNTNKTLRKLRAIYRKLDTDTLSDNKREQLVLDAERLQKQLPKFLYISVDTTTVNVKHNGPAVAAILEETGDLVYVTKEHKMTV